jgi:hypothetical protein
MGEASFNNINDGLDVRYGRKKIKNSIKTYKKEKA